MSATATSPLLSVETLTVGFKTEEGGAVRVVEDVSFHLAPGEMVGLVGESGCGKSVTAMSILKLLPMPPAFIAGGRILFEGQDITRAPARKILAMGIAHCPEGRRVFPYMTVQENLEMGCYLRTDADGIAADMRRLFERFPILNERRDQAAGTLSGGEQQMLAISRALMSRPKLVLFDEPSLGLAPNLVERTFDIVREIRAEGVTVVMVEQNAFAALELSDRSYVLEQGRATLTGTGAELLQNPHVKSAYLGA